MTCGNRVEFKSKRQTQFALDPVQEAREKIRQKRTLNETTQTKALFKLKTKKYLRVFFLELQI